MPIIMTTMWYPISKRIEVGKKFIEAAKKFPPDETIAKNLGTGVMRDKHGAKIIVMSEVMEGKLQEALERANETIGLFNDIEGFNTRIDLMATALEAWESINMKPPE